MSIEIVGKFIAFKLLGYGFDKVKGLLRQTPMLEAFERACIGVVKEEKHFFDQYSAQALGSSAGISHEECLLFKLEQSFDSNSFPNIPQLTEMLIESWRDRKNLIAPSIASQFFSLSEDEARPVVKKISEKFFRELAQIPELRNPFIIQELQKISHQFEELTKPQKPITSFEDLKDAAHKASTSLFIWPTTLGDNQWLKRSELETLIDRIETNEYSTTILLGPPGSGKSALLSILGQELKDKGLPVLAIKADKIPSTIDSNEKLKNHLNLPLTVDACLDHLAKEGKTILIIDQLDALSEIVDRKSERLNVLLNLIQTVSLLKNVHIVSSSRWFEFRHDTRLNTIQADQLELGPLSWEQVQMMLSKFSIDDQNWSDETQRLLKVPLHLKILLDLKERNKSAIISVSLQCLLEELWQQRVLGREGVAGRNTLVHELAQKMSEDEELWVSRALGDSNPEALGDLQRQEILTLDENGLRIGFRHQTYFDFARARYFAQGREKLSEYIIERQDGLFIRPVLLSTLDYLRVSNPADYRRELLKLWNNPDLRSHLRSLIIEFLGSLENPDDVEINCLLPILKNEATQHRALIAMAGSQGWFKVLKKGILADLMSQPPERATLCVSLLTQAMPFDQEGVMNHIRKWWFDGPQYDSLTLNVFQYLKVWDESSADMISLLARRSNSWGIPYVTEIISQTNPILAPRIVRADLDRRLIEAEKTDAQICLQPQPADDASSEDLLLYRINNEPHKNVKGLLEKDLGWNELSVIAESAPEAFLDQIWPWFVSVLEHITEESHPFVVGFRDDHSIGTLLDRHHGTETQPVSALRDAIVFLAESNHPVFLNFFYKNETSPFLAVHRLLCKGLVKIARNYPKVVLDYLIKDQRRLVVGGLQDHHSESRALITCVAPFLDRADLDDLEKTVLEWNRYYRNEESWTPEDRFNRNKWNRQHRLRLLWAFPENCLSEQTKKFRSQEERAFPGLQNWDCKFSGVSCVGSPMTSDQMRKAKEPDILNLFEELIDSTGWDHPRYKKFEKSVGGIIQASRELETFAEQEPEKAAKLLVHFKPGQQELAAGSIMKGIAKSDYSSNNLFQFVIDLDDSGFQGNHFRTDVAMALEERAKKGNGLSDEILQLMESWLPSHAEPTCDRTQDKKTEIDGSILWGMNGFITIPGGRDQIFDAIAQGYLLRKPHDISGWAKVVERALDYETHPDVWESILMNMLYLYSGDCLIATDLFDRVITRFPQSLESTVTVRTISRILPLVNNLGIINKWLNFYRNGVWVLGQQSYGEMLMWYFCHHPDVTWAKQEIQNALNDPNLIGVHRGIAFAAANNWSSSVCQDQCTSALLDLAGSNDQVVHQAISIVFRGIETIQINTHMRTIIESIILNDKLLMESAINLIEGLESATSGEPELVFKVCSRFLDIGAEDIKNMATRYAYLAEPLVSIALTLHRMSSPHREMGLILFEKLSESNIQEARQALDNLDRRPLRSKLNRPGHRRRKRRKNR